MNILVTGATSKIGRSLIRSLINESDIHIYCITRRPEKLADLISRYSDRIEAVGVDLTGDLRALESLPPIDVCYHFAGLTHSKDPAQYFKVNTHATISLAKAIWDRCNKFCFISSQTAGFGAGEYAESKILAEKALLDMIPAKVLIIRPSEVVGAGGQEGLDKLMFWAKNFHVVPLFFSWQKVCFYPVSVEDLTREMILAAESYSNLGKVISLQGPRISSIRVWQDLNRKFGAIPIPIFAPALGWVLAVLRKFGITPIPPDQVPRMLGQRGQLPSLNRKKIEPLSIFSIRELPFNFSSYLNTLS